MFWPKRRLQKTPPCRDTKTPSLNVTAFSCRGPEARQPARILASAPCYPLSCRSIQAGPRFNITFAWEKRSRFYRKQAITEEVARELA